MKNRIYSRRLVRITFITVCLVLFVMLVQDIVILRQSNSISEKPEVTEKYLDIHKLYALNENEHISMKNLLSMEYTKATIHRAPLDITIADNSLLLDLIGHEIQENLSVIVLTTEKGGKILFWYNMNNCIFYTQEGELIQCFTFHGNATIFHYPSKDINYAHCYVVDVQ